MADNSTPETSADNYSFNDAVASLLQDPPQEENQVVDEAAEAADIDAADQSEPEEAEIEEAEGEEEAESDEEQLEDDEDTEASEDEEAEDEDQEPELYTVKVDGEEMEVDLETLKSGFMMQSAFTKRTQELAATRKKLDAEMHEARAARDQYAQLAEGMLQALQANQQEPDWESLKAQLSPTEYADAIRIYQQRQAESANLEQSLAHIQAERENEARHNIQVHLQNEKQHMLDAIPEWRDDTVRDNERPLVMAHAKKLGFTEQEISQAADHRAVKMLRDSWLLSKVNSKAETAKKKVRKAPKVAKAGTPTTKAEGQTRRNRQLRQRFDKERSFNAAVDLLLEN